MSFIFIIMMSDVGERLNRVAVAPASTAAMILAEEHVVSAKEANGNSEWSPDYHRFWFAFNGASRSGAERTNSIGAS
jgi:hypothetical protein